MENTFYALRILVVVLCGIPALLGVVMAYGLFKRQRYLPIVGTITDAKVEEEKSQDGDPWYSIEIEMKYEVQGQSYQKRPSFATWSGLRTYDDHVQRLTDFPIGTKRTIFYDPNDPQSYALENENSLSDWLFTLGIILLPTGFAVLFWSKS